jgi:Rod binding domain-containing protein
MQTSQVNTNSATAYTPENIRKIAQEYESLFTSTMLKAMRSTVGDNPLIPSGFGEQVYTDMLDQKYSELISSHGSIGLADIIVKQLEQLGVTDNSSLQELRNLKNDSWRMDNRLLPQGIPFNDSKSIGNLKSGVNRWEGLIDEASKEHGVDKSLISAVIAQESAGNPYAISKAGAKGLMQLMDSTALDMGVTSSFSPQANIYGGVKYLRRMLEKHNGDERLALAAYNAGPAAVEKYNGVPPYVETQNYVESVLNLKKLFEQNSSDGDK